jgi:hypothetical protein
MVKALAGSAAMNQNESKMHPLFCCFQRDQQTSQNISQLSEIQAYSLSAHEIALLHEGSKLHGILQSLAGVCA